jgi:hypothetical protein
MENAIMNCEAAVSLLTGAAEGATADDRRAARAHASACAACRAAVMSVHALRLMSVSPVPEAPPGAFERMLSRVAAGRSTEPRSPARFWQGVAVGAALAAGMAFVAVTWLPLPEDPVRGDPAASATPQLSLRVNETRDVSITLTTGEALEDAEIHVSLNGSIGLQGYAGERELKWHTNLDAGTNQLTLPIVATGSEGGQLLVEVTHGGKRRTFLVDVDARAG